MIPNTPIANGLTEPLVSVAQYQSITGDTASGSDAVKEAIADAVYMICQECHRTLTYGTYKENLYLYALGMVFPSAAPIDHNQPISSGELSTTRRRTTSRAKARSSREPGSGSAWFTPLPWMPVWTVLHSPSVPTSSIPGLPALPRGRRARTGVYLRVCPQPWPPRRDGIPTRSASPGCPGGVKSSSVGGVSMSGDLSPSLHPGSQPEASDPSVPASTGQSLGDLMPGIPLATTLISVQRATANPETASGLRPSSRAPGHHRREGARK